MWVIKIIRSKKAVELPLNVIIIAAILLIALFLILAVFTDLFGKQTTQLREKIESLDDCDGDNQAKLFDPCPCTESSTCPGEGKLITWDTLKCGPKK